MGFVDLAPSPREAEVLELVGQHLTNAQIARRLFISERTVESHVSALLRKSGLDDRRALATYAFEQANAFTLRWPAGPFTSFVGRDVERARLEAALGQHRLITLVGPGGVGKTRLALCALEGRRAAFADLSNLPVGAGPDAVARAVASAVGMVEPAGCSALDAVSEQLTGITAVVVLDNCEHLIDSAAVMAERLLAGGSTVLATSRERLAVPGEHVVQVGPLPDDVAVALFLDRVEGTAPEMLIDCPRVLELCAQLEGIPLVIELAAARLGALSFDDLMSRLDQAVTLLGSGGGSRHRHRSLRATLDWSYNLLTEDEQALYRYLSVLRGPSRLAVIEELVPAHGRGLVAAGVAHLVEASLLARQGDRYRQLGLIRADALERLGAEGEESEALGRLVDWAIRSLAGGVLDGDECDLDAAVAAARHLSRPELVTLASGVAEAWQEVGHWADAEALYELAARASGLPAHAIAGAELAWSRFFGDRAVELFGLALELASAQGDAAAEARAAAGAVEVLCRFGGTLRGSPGPGAEQRLVERAEAAAGRAGDDVSIARAALARIWTVHEDMEAELLRKAADHTVELARASDDITVLCSALDLQTGAAMEGRRLEDAKAIIDQRLEITEGFRSLRPRYVIERVDTLSMACEVLCLMGEFEEMLDQAVQLDKFARRRGIFYGGLMHLVPANFFLGHFDECLALAAGVYGDVTQRPEVGAGVLMRAFSCAGAVSGYQGHSHASQRWFGRARELANSRHCNKNIFLTFMEADVHLHHGRRDEAAALLEAPPLTVAAGWAGWYGAVRAEARGGAAIAEAEVAIGDGAYSRAILARAKGELDEALAIFQSCGATYQVARTALQMGEPWREEGATAYQQLGLGEYLPAM
jgi:predicted ATPase/DNA-binding CsgD family transcriptional regulator